jgi:hypothetical protein
MLAAMLRAIAGVQKVEVVAGESWLSHDLGPILLALAAVSAAALAAYVSVHNQRQQLAHDRHLRNQDHIRDTIDAAVAVTNETQAAMTAFLGSVLALEFKRSDRALKAGVADPLQTLAGDHEEHPEVTSPDTMSIAAATDRLAMRLGPNHPIVATHRAASDALVNVLFNAVGGLRTNRGGAKIQADGARMQSLENALGAFRSACHDWFNK